MLIVIEVRQHLCCANVFLTFQRSVTDFDSLRINVEESLIRLKDSACASVIEVNIAKYFSILTETFSNLVVDRENVSFRISLQIIQDLNQDSNGKHKYQSPPFQLKEQQNVSLHCKQCESTLCDLQTYEKVREFPSGSIDISEFFCHHGPTFTDVLLPRKRDIFYGFLFVIVNMENIELAVKQREGKHLYCGRCSRYLGETMFDNKASKLWSESLTMKYENELEYKDLYSIENETILNLLMLKVINETSLPSQEPLLQNMHFTKVLLETTLANRRQQYLLVHILEKNLPVLKNVEHLEEVQPNANSFIQLLKVPLVLCQAFKLLYRLISVEQTEIDDDPSDEPPMLSYWQQDINILKMNISPFLFRQLVDELNCNSLLLPEIYRNNKDQFTLSYIFQ